MWILVDRVSNVAAPCVETNWNAAVM